MAVALPAPSTPSTKSGTASPHALLTPRGRARLVPRGRTSPIFRADRRMMVAVAVLFRAPGTSSKVSSLEKEVLSILQTARGRGKDGLTREQRDTLEGAIEQLEAAGGVPDPTTTAEINGVWRLLYTSRPSSSSPIQRTFTGIESFKVYQEVFLQAEVARINNCVDFGRKVGFLKVEALANTDSRPIEGFVPRRGAGLPIFGKSSAEPPSAKNTRIDFQFDRAAFDLRILPFSIPYPVPFRLIGDEGKGWIDVTYMSEDGSFRISRGNKGTTFVLVKDKTPGQEVLDAVASGDDNAVKEMIANMENPTKSPALSPLTQGKWRLRWSAQAENANFLQKNLAGKVQNFQILYKDLDGNSRAQNLVELGPLLKVKADAFCQPGGADRTMVDIKEVVFQIGSFEFPVKVNKDRKPEDPAGFVDWLYLDEEMRITRGSKGSLFIHTREP